MSFSPVVSWMDINLSDRCNFSCDFCYAKNNFGIGPDFERTRAAFLWLFGQAKENSRLHVCFYGGEPLVEWDTLVKVVDWALGVYPNLRFYIISNVSLFDAEKAAWCAARDCFVCASVDGCAEAQEMHRGSSEVVFQNVKHAAKTHPEMDMLVRGTVTPENVHLLAESIVFMCEEFRLPKTTILPSTSSDWRQQHLDEYDDQLGRVADWWVEQMRAGKYYYVNAICQTLKLSFGKGRPKRACNAAVGRVGVDTKNDIWPCNRFTNYDACPQYKLGSVEKGYTNEEMFQRFREFDIARKPECADCPAGQSKSCPGICHHVAMKHSRGKSFYEVSPSYCEFMRIRWSHASRVHAVLSAEKNPLYFQTYKEANTAGE